MPLNEMTAFKSLFVVDERMISLAKTSCANVESDKLSHIPWGSLMVNKLKEKSIVKLITEHRL